MHMILHTCPTSQTVVEIVIYKGTNSILEEIKTTQEPQQHTVRPSCL